MRHLLVTNDFPPKIGGIQSYLWELWRRLPPADVTVLTTPHPSAPAWDAQQGFRVVRTRERWLLPRPSLARRIDALAAEVGAEVVILDPAFPLGALGPWLARPYALVVHGTELTVPSRVPGVRQVLARTVRSARVVIAAGEWVGASARALASDQAASVVAIAPGVDVERFRPLDAAARARARSAFDLDPEARLVLGVGRLVPRKGFDRLIAAVERLGRHRADVHLAIAGSGRDQRRLARHARRARTPVRLLGRVSDEMLPALYGSADVFAMPCRARWLGLEEEGFGIVFLEAAAAGVPQIAGASGGTHEAVVDHETGLVVDDPTSIDALAASLATLLDDDALRTRLAANGRARVERAFAYEGLARRLASALDAAAG